MTHRVGRVAGRIGAAVVAMPLALGCGGGAGADADGSGGTSTGSGGSTSGTGGGGGTGGSTGPPAACAARMAADTSFAPVTTEIAVAGVVPDIFTDFFAGDAAIAEDVLVVGLPAWLSDVDMDHATALTFRFDGSTWQFEQELLPAAAPIVRFGSKVEVSSSGRTIIVSDRFSAFIFRRVNDQWIGGEELRPRNPDDFLADVAVTDDRAIAGYYKNGDLPGSAYIYRREADTWVLDQRIVDTRLDSSSGTGVAISGDWAAVTDRQSSTFLFAREGDEWVEKQELRVSHDPSIDGTHFEGRAGGSIDVYELGADGWVECESVRCNDQCDSAISGSWLVGGGAPTYASGGDATLWAYDGSGWQVAHEPGIEARTADVSQHFAVFTAEGSTAAPLQIVQTAASP